MKLIYAALFIFALCGCSVIPDTPRAGREAAAQGTPVALNEPVWVGDANLKPLSVVEDSRCAEDTRCVWAGRLVVSTRIISTHWQQTAPLTLDEPYEVLGRTFVLVSGQPAKRLDREIQSEDYRFVFERR